MATDKERFRESLKTLNETQKESVLSDAQSLQILAGPGSGKTRGKYEIGYFSKTKNKKNHLFMQICPSSVDF